MRITECALVADVPHPRALLNQCHRPFNSLHHLLLHLGMPLLAGTPSRRWKVPMSNSPLPILLWNTKGLPDGSLQIGKTGHPVVQNGSCEGAEPPHAF
jgi:hypothetical protein